MYKYINFHHYGLAVKDFKDAIKFHKNLGYRFSNEIYDENQNVNLILCTSKNYPSVELVKPINEKSPINNYISKNNEIIYHVCYEVNLKKISMDKFFLYNRYICVSKPKPAKLFNFRKVSFYYVKNLGLVEILEKNEVY